LQCRQQRQEPDQHQPAEQAEVVAAAEVLSERVAGGDSRGGADGFEARIGRSRGLQPVMIGFGPVVVVLLGDVGGGWDQFVQGPWLSAWGKNRRAAAVKR
jgi:hypothetical protein